MADAHAKIPCDVSRHKAVMVDAGYCPYGMFQFGTDHPGIVLSQECRDQCMVTTFHLSAYRPEWFVC